jgi:hypothetical protein
MIASPIHSQFCCNLSHDCLNATIVWQCTLFTLIFEVFLRYTIPPNGSTVIIVFQFLTMGKMVICPINIIWKKFCCQGYIKDLISYIITILFCIFSIILIYYTYHLLIPPYHTKKLVVWNCQTLHICPFLLHTSHFQPVVRSGIVYSKKTSKFLPLLTFLLQCVTIHLI